MAGPSLLKSYEGVVNSKPGAVPLVWVETDMSCGARSPRERYSARATGAIDGVAAPGVGVEVGPAPRAPARPRKTSSAATPTAKAPTIADPATWMNRRRDQDADTAATVARFSEGPLKTRPRSVAAGRGDGIVSSGHGRHDAPGPQPAAPRTPHPPSAPPSCAHSLMRPIGATTSTTRPPSRTRNTTPAARTTGARGGPSRPDHARQPDPTCGRGAQRHLRGGGPPLADAQPGQRLRA